MGARLQSLTLLGLFAVLQPTRVLAQDLSPRAPGVARGREAGPSLHAGKVMPANAIQVFDPGLSATGEPTPLLRHTEDGGLEVEVPPTVHVHRYFPSGPREFQAQYFAGGPTLVSVRHPYSGERVNVLLDLPPGFPIVKYELDEIEYRYPEESFTIHFEKDGGATTSYSRCGVVKLKARQSADRLKECSRDWGERLGLNELAGKVGKEVRETADGTTVRARQFITQSGNLLITAVNAVPGVQLLQSAAENRATRYRDQAVKRVTRERGRAEEEIRTLY